ncbi:MAG: hypothetical protein LC751_03665 [Actinobacteria bacterium]|nr:hypothetical protein [Actinomycetota bacterium]
MGKRSIRRKIEQISESLPPLPPTLEELPVEAWVAEIMEAHAPPPALYDEDFWPWLEALPDDVCDSLRRRLARVWGTACDNELSSETAAQIAKRADKVLVPYIDRYWDQFRAAKGQRDQRHIYMAELAAEVGVQVDFFPNTDTPEEIRQRLEKLKAKLPKERKGRDWVIRSQLERAELAERYEHWPEEWRRFYAEWWKDNEG